MDLGLAGKTAIVTGAGNGIGAATAQRLAAEGAKVGVVDIDQVAARAQAQHLCEAGAQAIALAADVTREQDVETMVARTVEAFGTVHVLVNNAGFTRDMRIGRMAVSDWDAVVDVIIKGAFLCTRAVVPIMSEQRWGRIVNISSRSHLGNPGQANYSAAKAGLIGFTRAMSLELGRNYITVNAVAPGIIDTEAVRRLPHFEKVRENAIRTTPIPRLGVPEDVADVVAFLASDRAAYLSGDVVHVTGGRY